MPNGDSYYYDGPLPADDGGTYLFLILLIIGFVAAMIWLVNYEPEKKKEKADLATEVEKTFAELREYAGTFGRKDFIPSLEVAREKVLKAIADLKKKT